MKIKFEDIIIPESFVATTPREEKMEECRFWYKNYGRLDREIVIDYNNKIIDGYIGYLVLKENGFSGEITVKQSDRRKKRWFRKHTESWTGANSYRNNPTTYVYGNHHENGKEFMWRVPNGKVNKIDHIVIGKPVLANTKFGNKVITVTRVEEYDKCPVNFIVRKVIVF